QLASNLAAILLVLPMFYLGKALFDRGVAFWGTLLFNVLPVGGHLLSDGLSESLFLLFAITGLLFAVRGLQRPSIKTFALCGVFAGLSYLTRPEGALIVVATCLTLLLMQCVPHQRRPWRHALACAGTLGIAGIVVGAPYWAATGKFTNKPSVNHFLKAEGGASHGALTQPRSLAVACEVRVGKRDVREPRCTPYLFGNLWAATLHEG